MKYIGTVGNDVRHGTAGKDTLNLSQGGNDRAYGGDGNDTIYGGGGEDYIEGGGGADMLTAASFGNVFIYTAVSDSTGATHDTITGMNFDNEFILAPVSNPSAIDTAVTSGALDSGSFDANLAAAIGATELGAGHAVLFTPDSGDLAGHTFLIVDQDGNAGYQASADLVIDVTGYSGTLDTASFF